MINENRAGTNGDDVIIVPNNKNVIVRHDGNDMINLYQGNILKFKNLQVHETSVIK
jgi:ribosomal protein S17